MRVKASKAAERFLRAGLLSMLGKPLDLTTLYNLARAFVKRVDRVNKRQFYRTLSVAEDNFDLSKIIQTNLDLITSVNREYLNAIVGKTPDEIQHLTGLAHSRAKLIARDQTSKLNGKLNETRQTNLGIEKYIWRTVRDSRARSRHAENNGKVFRWDTPPQDTGHPGNDYQCRCIAQPILPQRLRAGEI